MSLLSCVTDVVVERSVLTEINEDVMMLCYNVQQLVSSAN